MVRVILLAEIAARCLFDAGKLVKTLMEQFLALGKLLLQISKGYWLLQCIIQTDAVSHEGDFGKRKICNYK